MLKKKKKEGTYGKAEREETPDVPSLKIIFNTGIQTYPCQLTAKMTEM